MKLLFVARAYYPAVKYGGPVTSLRRICTSLAAAGHEVTVICSNMASSGRRGERLPAGRVEMEGVSVWFIETPITYHWEGLTWKGLGPVADEVSRTDVLHVAGTRHFFGVIAETVARRHRIPYLVIPEGSVPARFRSVIVKHAVDGMYTKRSLRRAYRVLATSDAELEDLADWGVPRQKLLKLPPRGDTVGVDPRSVHELRAQRGIPRDAKVLLWMGRLHPKKGIPLLLDALQDARLRDLRLLLAGEAEDPTYERQLKDHVSRAGLEGRVTFLGWVGHDEKGELMKLADLFVCPSINENFGLGAAEAVAAGLPVVLTNGCGIAPLLQNRVALVCDYDLKSLADAIHRVTADSALMERFRAATTEVSKELDSPPVVPFLEQIYREAVTERAARATHEGTPARP